MVNKQKGEGTVFCDVSDFTCPFVDYMKRFCLLTVCVLQLFQIDATLMILQGTLSFGDRGIASVASHSSDLKNVTVVAALSVV